MKKKISKSSLKIVEPFLINFVDKFEFLRQVKDHKLVHVVQIPIHLYISKLVSRKGRFKLILIKNFYLTSTSRNF